MATTFDATAQMLGDNYLKVFVGLLIVNVGSPASIHTWQVTYRAPNQPSRTHLVDGLLFEGKVERLPETIKGSNLHGDYRMLATGETREGWIAFDIAENDVRSDRQRCSIVS